MRGGAPGNGSNADVLSAVLSSVPFFRGKGRLTNALAQIAAKRRRGWGTCSAGNGAMLRVNLNERIERLMWGRCYEDHIQQCLRALLADGDAFVDIGAHIGFHAVLASSLVGPSGSVFAFEPDPGNFARLLEHLRPFSWGTALNKAVWSTTGTLLFERSSEPGESGWATLTTVRDLNRGEHISVSTVSLDDWAGENCLNKVAAIKIDAEGSEVGILQGAQDLLDRAKPAVIAEANSVVLGQAGTSPQELVRTLQARGYEIFELQGKNLERLQFAQPPQSFEVLGIHAERLDATMRSLQRRGIRERQRT